MWIFHALRSVVTSTTILDGHPWYYKMLTKEILCLLIGLDGKDVYLHTLVSSILFSLKIAQISFCCKMLCPVIFGSVMHFTWPQNEELDPRAKMDIRNYMFLCRLYYTSISFGWAKISPALWYHFINHFICHEPCLFELLENWYGIKLIYYLHSR